MNMIERLAAGGITSLVIGLFTVTIVSAAYQSKQEPLEVHRATVTSVSPYTANNDLHVRIAGIGVGIEGIDGAIYYNISNWDESVEVGDTVDAQMKRFFPGINRFKGSYITDNK